MVLSVLQINRHSSSTLWIGLNDIGTEASYKWSDGSPVAYTNYNYQEPNDWIGVEDCLEMHRWNGKWNDLHCSMLRPYICKKTNSKYASFFFYNNNINNNNNYNNNNNNTSFIDNKAKLKNLIYNQFHLKKLLKSKHYLHNSF